MMSGWLRRPPMDRSGIMFKSIRARPDHGWNNLCGHPVHKLAVGEGQVEIKSETKKEVQGQGAGMGIKRFAFFSRSIALQSSFLPSLLPPHGWTKLKASVVMGGRRRKTLENLFLFFLSLCRPDYLYIQVRCWKGRGLTFRQHLSGFISRWLWEGARRVTL